VACWLPQGAAICRGAAFFGVAERLRSETALVLLFAPGDDHEGVVGQFSASLVGAVIQVSISSRVVRMTGMAFG
jgi:hypothetical protein